MVSPLQTKLALICIIGIPVLSLIFILIRNWYRCTHCPDCGHRLGPLKEGMSGWLYKECPNPECTTKAIGYEVLLKS